MSISFIKASTHTHWEDAKALFSRYAQWLQDTYALNICFQGYQKEIANVQEKYGAPDGAIWLAYAQNHCVGCIAFYRLDDTSAELKRLYVLPTHQGKSIGRQLVSLAIQDCEERGYRAIYLDTLKRMGNAITLYTHHGFTPTSPYNTSHEHADDVMYFCKRLTKDTGDAHPKTMSYSL